MEDDCYAKRDGKAKKGDSGGSSGDGDSAKTAHAFLAMKGPYPSAPTRYDPSDFAMVDAERSSLYNEVGEPTFEYFTDYAGNNAHLPERCYKHGNSFFDGDHVSGKFGWANPPFREAEHALRHYFNCKGNDPTNTSSIWILPYEPAAKWYPLVANLRLLRKWPAGTMLFTLPDLKAPGLRRVLKPTPFPVMALYDAPLGSDSSPAGIQPSFAALVCPNPRQAQLLVDSGATDHMTGDIRLLHDYEPYSYVHTISGVAQTKMNATGTGTIKIESMIGGKVAQTSFKDVMHIEEMPFTLISLGKITSAGGRFEGHDDELTVYHGDEPCFAAYKSGGLYRIDDSFTSITLPKDPQVAFTKALMAGRDPGDPSFGQSLLAKADARTWHRRFGHHPYRNQELGAIDISNAFLNAKLRIPVYMRMPEGYGARDGNGDAVWQLNKTLYGLKQSPKEWYELLSASLGDIGLECCPCDQALWRAKPAGDAGSIYMLHWVDDLLIAADSEAAMSSIKSKILSKFKGRDLGNANSYLNMLITRDRAARTLKLSQPNHIHDFLALINLLECKPKDVPMTVGADFTALHDGDKPFAEITVYQRAVGALMYIANCTRPDLAYAASCLARHMSKPAERHWQQLKAVGRYLSATKDFGITFGSNAGSLVGYVDSDYAGDKETRRSRTGYVFMLGGGPISWQSKLQSVVATSTAEAEYVAGAHAAREAVWLRRVACFLGVPTADALPVHIDNQAALHMATNGSDSARTKHIDVVHHFLREAVARGSIRMVYISTEDNPADIFTKALPAIKLTKFRGLMGVA